MKSKTKADVLKSPSGRTPKVQESRNLQPSANDSENQLKGKGKVRPGGHFSEQNEALARKTE